MLGESLHLTSEYLAQEAKVESALSQVMTLEANNSKLKKDLIVAMNEANLAKEKFKTLTDELRTERQLTLEKTSNLQLPGRRSKALLPRPSRAFSKLRSSTLCSSVGTSRGSSF